MTGKLHKFELGIVVTLALAFVGAVAEYTHWRGKVEARLDALNPDTTKQILNKMENITSQDPFAPVGTIVPYAGEIRLPEDIPVGWLLCDGSPIPDGPEYAALRTLIRKTAWGTQTTSDEETTVYLPDLRGVFIRGLDDPDGSGSNAPAGNDPDATNRIVKRNGQTVGNVVGSYQSDAMQTHTHIDSGHQHGYSIARTAGGGDNARDNDFEEHETVQTGLGHAKLGGPTKYGSEDVRTATETRSRNAAVNFLVKY